MQPPPTLSRPSGITRLGSMSMVRPKPLQDSQAPTGLLNENTAGVGSA